MQTAILFILALWVYALADRIIELVTVYTGFNLHLKNNAELGDRLVAAVNEMVAKVNRQYKAFDEDISGLESSVAALQSRIAPAVLCGTKTKAKAKKPGKRA